jgi:hypothetical protein
VLFVGQILETGEGCVQSFLTIENNAKLQQA